MKRQINQFDQLDFSLYSDHINQDLEFEVKILETNNKEADLLIKKGYKIKKCVWKGLIAS